MARVWAVLAWLSAAGLSYTQTLEVTPSRALDDQAPAIRATGLGPNEHVTLRADLIDGDDKPWRASAEFVADASGVVDVSQQAPVKGSYNKVSAAGLIWSGLIWSMMPAASHVEIYRPPKQFGPQTIHFTLERNGQTAATAEFVQLAIADGVKRVVLHGELHGTLFEPSGDGPFPGVLVLGGSEGGLPSRNAAWLASHGYAALALAYFRYEDLPKQLQNIPLEYFGEALQWMTTRPEIDKDRIGVMGVSRGGELALQLGSMYKFKAVVAFVPSNARRGACCAPQGGRFGFSAPAWTWKGTPLAFETVRNADPRMEMAAEIAVERTQGPILVISGQDDGVWESSPMCDRVIARLKNAHFEYAYEQLKYPHAGHRAGHPAIIPAWHGKVEHPVSGRPVNYGGTPEGNAASSIDAAPKVVEFLEKGLK